MEIDEFFIGDTKIRKNKHSFEMFFKYPSHSIIRSFIKTKLINGGSTNENYNYIKFYANSVKSLKKVIEEHNQNKTKKNINPSIVATSKLKMPNIICMMVSLVRQLNYLISEENCVFIGYNPSEVIVINEEIFLCIDTEHLERINDENKIIISSPFSFFDFFVSPELLKINELPTYVSYKSVYFSLACLIIFAITNSDHFYLTYLENKNNPNKDEIILNVLKNHSIYLSKIYWFLSRCLNEDPKKRCIIFL